MTNFVGLDVSQKMTAICVVDNAGQQTVAGPVPHGSEADRRYGASTCGG